MALVNNKIFKQRNIEEVIAYPRSSSSFKICKKIYKGSELIWEKLTPDRYCTSFCTGSKYSRLISITTTYSERPNENFVISYPGKIPTLSLVIEQKNRANNNNFANKYISFEKYFSELQGDIEVITESGTEYIWNEWVIDNYSSIKKGFNYDTFFIRFKHCQYKSDRFAFNDEENHTLEYTGKTLIDTFDYNTYIGYTQDGINWNFFNLSDQISSTATPSVIYGLKNELLIIINNNVYKTVNLKRVVLEDLKIDDYVFSSLQYKIPDNGGPYVPVFISMYKFIYDENKKHIRTDYLNRTLIFGENGEIVFSKNYTWDSLNIPENKDKYLNGGYTAHSAIASSNLCFFPNNGSTYQMCYFYDSNSHYYYYIVFEIDVNGKFLSHFKIETLTDTNGTVFNSGVYIFPILVKGEIMVGKRFYRYDNGENIVTYNDFSFSPEGMGTQIPFTQETKYFIQNNNLIIVCRNEDFNFSLGANESTYNFLHNIGYGDFITYDTWSKKYTFNGIVINSKWLLLYGITNGISTPEYILTSKTEKNIGNGLQRVRKIGCFLDYDGFVCEDYDITDDSYCYYWKDTYSVPSDSVYIYHWTYTDSYLNGEFYSRTWYFKGYSSISTDYHSFSNGRFT